MRKHYRRERRRGYLFRSYDYLIESYNLAACRWKANMPKCFKCIFWICSCIFTTAVGIQIMWKLSDSRIPMWWEDIYPYITSIPFGAGLISKFTRENPNGEIKNPDKAFVPKQYLSGDNEGNNMM